MYAVGYTAEITGLSPRATEKDVHEFFSHCGVVEHVEIIRFGDQGCAAYVTFRDAYALETAVLLSGATILDQRVCISHWGRHGNELDSWHDLSQSKEENYGLTENHTKQYVSSPGEAVTVAQEVVKTMLAKGYVLGKDALVKAKALDESCKFSSTTASKFMELSDRIGLTERINYSRQAMKSADEKYHISEFTRSAVLATGTVALTAATITGKAASTAATAVVNSSYFAKGASWVSNALGRASKATANLAGGHGK